MPGEEKFRIRTKKNFPKIKTSRNIVLYLQFLMHVYIYIYIHVYIYTQTHTDTHIYVHIYMHIYKAYICIYYIGVYI